MRNDRRDERDDSIHPLVNIEALDEKPESVLVAASDNSTILDNHSKSEARTAADLASVAVAPSAQLNSLAIVTTDTSSSSLNRVRIRTVPTENRPLNEYLVSELELFASVMLGERVLVEARRINRAAHATTLQLYYDHTRALRDFDAEWER